MNISWRTYNDTDRVYMTGTSTASGPFVAYRNVDATTSNDFSGSATVSSIPLAGYMSILGAAKNVGGTNYKQSDFWEFVRIAKSESVTCTPPWYQTSVGGDFTNAWWCDRTSSGLNPQTATGTVAFTVHFKRRQYSIKYYAHGSEISPPTGFPSSYNAGVRTTFTLSDISDPGYVFGGWYDNSSFSGNPITSVTIATTDYGDRVYYAKFTTVQVVVVFDPNGGTISTSDSYFKRVTTGSPYGTLPTPTRSGYSFAGWYTEKIGGALVDANTTVTIMQDHVLYAHWTPVSVQYILYFNANGGTVPEPSRQMTEGSAYGTLPVPTWTNYSFVGWFTDMQGGTQVSASTTMGNDDTTVYAHWTRNMITVPFDGNGGTPDVPSAEYPAGSVYGILPSATRSGYVFTGWYNYATGGTQVPPSATVTSQILYAHWQEQGDPVSGVIWNSNNTDCILENS